MILFDPDALRMQIDRAADALAVEQGAAAAVVEMTRGPMSVRLAAGLSDLDSGTPARSDQTFEIGSQTKMMTAVVVLQLAEQGLIDLDRPASDWLPPEVVSGVPNAEAATVRQMLAMTSGVPNYTEAADEQGRSLLAQALLERPGVPFGPDDALALARAMEATGAPGAAFAYSNTNYLLLGALIENVIGEPVAHAFEERIFEVAGMGATTARPFESDDPRLSSYATDPETGAPLDVTDAPLVLRGDGGVVSTTADMTAFLEALLVDRTLLSEASLAEMTDFRAYEEGPGVVATFGLGLSRIAIDGGPDLVGFTGQTFGTTSSTYLDLATGAIVSIGATSGDAATDGAAIQLAIAAASDPAWSPIRGDAADGVRFASGSAAGVAVSAQAGSVVLSLDDATLALEGGLDDLARGGVSFDDGSKLLIGGAGADRLVSFRADDQLIGRAGRDILASGGGEDRALGGAGDDALLGACGGDTLRGGAGEDRLVGGLGADLLQGGAGADIFEFRSLPESSSGLGADTIRGFASGEDRIDLRAIGHVDWVGQAAFSETAGELSFRCGALLLDADGDGQADLTIRILGDARVTACDFML